MKKRKERSGPRKRGCLSCAGLALLGACLTAAPLFPQGTAGVPLSPQVAPRDQGYPSENTAWALSAIGTAAAVVTTLYPFDGGYIAAFSMMAGPSLGFMYGGCWGRGLLTTGLRLAGTFLAVSIYVGDDEANGTAGFAWLGGMALTAIVDLATVRKAVHKRNEAKMARRGLSFAVSPFAMPKGAGLRLQIGF